jgi:hypothetical protein
MKFVYTLPIVYSLAREIRLNLGFGLMIPSGYTGLANEQG